MKNLSGMKFHRLKVEKYFGFTRRANGCKRYYWKCVCECGAITIVRTELLKTGGVKSCGCLRREMAKARVDMARQAYSDQARERKLQAAAK